MIDHSNHLNYLILPRNKGAHQSSLGLDSSVIFFLLQLLLFSLDMRHFAAVIRKAEAIKQQCVDDDDDAPDEFLCELLGEVMTDPVVCI